MRNLDKAYIRLLIFTVALLILIWIYTLNIGELILLGFGLCALMFILLAVLMLLDNNKK